MVFWFSAHYLVLKGLQMIRGCRDLLSCPKSPVQPLFKSKTRRLKTLFYLPPFIRAVQVQDEASERRGFESIQSAVTCDADPSGQSRRGSYKSQRGLRQWNQPEDTVGGESHAHLKVISSWFQFHYSALGTCKSGYCLLLKCVVLGIKHHRFWFCVEFIHKLLSIWCRLYFVIAYGNNNTFFCFNN